MDDTKASKEEKECKIYERKEINRKVGELLGANFPLLKIRIEQNVKLQIEMGGLLYIECWSKEGNNKRNSNAKKDNKSDLIISKDDVGFVADFCSKSQRHPKCIRKRWAIEAHKVSKQWLSKDKIWNRRDKSRFIEKVTRETNRDLPSNSMIKYFPSQIRNWMNENIFTPLRNKRPPVWNALGVKVRRLSNRLARG